LVVVVLVVVLNVVLVVAPAAQATHAERRRITACFMMCE
jgi:hypothetical protein